MRVIGCAVDHADLREDDVVVFEQGSVYEVSACLVCSKVTLREGWWHEGMENASDWQPAILYPEATASDACASRLVLRPKERREKPSSDGVKLFISHSSRDAQLVTRLISLIRAGLKSFIDGDTLFKRGWVSTSGRREHGPDPCRRNSQCSSA